MRFRALAVTFLLSLSLMSCIYQPQSTHYVKPTMDFSKYKKIAIVRLESQDSSVGQEVADTIAISFSKRGYNVIERSQLRAIVDENIFIQSGITEDSKKALRIAGIEALVIGSVTKYDCTSERSAFVYQGIGASVTSNSCIASLSIKMVDVSTGDVLWTSQGSHSLKAAGMTAGKVMQEVIAEIEQSIPLREALLQPTVAAPIPGSTPASIPIFSRNTYTTKQHKADAIEWTEKSDESIKLKNWSEVIRTTSAAINIDPSYLAPYINRSWAYLEKGFYDEAFVDCQKVLELDSNNTAATNNRGLFYLKKGQPDLAKIDFERSCNGGLQVGCGNFKLVTGYTPSEKVEFFLKKADEAFNRRDWDSVIQYTSEISQSDVALSVRGGAFAYKGMFTEAIKDCDTAIKMNPNSALAYNNKGFTLELMGKKRDALLNYEFACNLKMNLGCDNLKRLTGQ